MARPRNLKLSQEQVSQKFNLKEIFGVDVSRNEDLKDAFSQMIIDHILERTKAGVDYNGKKFAKYSDEYKASLAFKAFRKSDRVDMELTGEMMGTMEILSSNGNEIELGFPADQCPKVFNHMTGDTVPERLFFGITPEEANQLAKQVKPTLGPQELLPISALESLFSKIDKFFNGSGGGSSGN